jgi:hypothetical protein
MTGAAGDTTTTNSRSRRNRASRRGGQLLTRALGSSCVSACPHLRAPGASVPMVAPYATVLDTAAERWHRHISYRLRTPSSGCTRSSSDESRRRPSCHQRTSRPCCSGLCSLPARSTCARPMAGKRSPRSPSISQLTSPLNQIASRFRRLRHSGFQPHPGRHARKNLTGFPVNLIVHTVFDRVAPHVKAVEMYADAFA